MDHFMMSMDKKVEIFLFPRKQSPENDIIIGINNIKVEPKDEETQT